MTLPNSRDVHADLDTKSNSTLKTNVKLVMILTARPVVINQLKPITTAKFVTLDTVLLVRNAKFALLTAPSVIPTRKFAKIVWLDTSKLMENTVHPREIDAPPTTKKDALFVSTTTTRDPNTVLNALI